jgi:hypothetical protein
MLLAYKIDNNVSFDPNTLIKWPKQPIKSKKISNKVRLVPQKKRAKKSYEGFPETQVEFKKS